MLKNQNIKSYFFINLMNHKTKRTINKDKEINPKINLAIPKKLLQSSFDVTKSKIQNNKKNIRKNTNLLKTIENLFWLELLATTFEDLFLFFTFFFFGILLSY